MLLQSHDAVPGTEQHHGHVRVSLRVCVASFLDASLRLCRRRVYCLDCSQYGRGQGLASVGLKKCMHDLGCDSNMGSD